MNISLWIVQIITAIKLLDVAYKHGLRQSMTSMQEAKQKLGAFSKPLLTIIAVCAFTGVLGLILPGLLGWAAWITPVTAALLSLMLLLSIFFHVRSRAHPKIFVSVVLFAFAIFVAYGRWALAPF
jgi:hypothetical protein